MDGVTQNDYPPRATQAARSVMLELARMLGEYREHVVIVGGWVPELLFPGSEHVGSTDVDLALDHTALADPGYETLLELLQGRGYEQHQEQPFIFYRTGEIDGDSVKVQIDLLGAEYGGTGTSHRTQPVQDVRARKARGCDLAFEQYEKLELEGELPGGARDQAVVRVASIPSFLIMKCMTLEGRLKEKDSWDIWFCLYHHEEGVQGIADALRPIADHGLVQEALDILREQFASPESIGPEHVADFDELNDEQREVRKRDAYERVQMLISKLEK